MAVRKVVVLIVVSERELYALFCDLTSIMCITYLLGPIFFTSFCNYRRFSIKPPGGLLSYKMGLIIEWGSIDFLNTFNS